MQGVAYQTSAELAASMGTFDGYEVNAEPMQEIIGKHADAFKDLGGVYDFGYASGIAQVTTPAHAHHRYQTWKDISAASDAAWKKCRGLGRKHGYRNAQVSVMAPTGTISFMMDCDTTGIEPELGLKKSKSLAGGGTLTLVNNVVEDALANLGYDSDVIEEVVAYVEEHGRVEGCGVVEDEHLPIFDCSFRSAGGTRVIEPLGHIKMMEAVQPFLSGAISKTVNVDTDTSVGEIKDLYMEAWRRGLKAIAIYRDGCKRTQPLTTKKKEVVDAPPRHRLPDERSAICHKFTIGGHEGYLHVGLYDDGSFGEIFIRMAKEGSTISGMMDAFATSISIGVQYGVPLATFVEKFKHTRFEPSGFTPNRDIKMAQSIIDYIFRYLELKFLAAESVVVDIPAVSLDVPPGVPVVRLQSDAPMCLNCGNMTVRNASCYKCPVCGSNSGCS